MDTKRIPPYPKKGLKNGSYIGFLDETGVSDRPNVRRTWSQRGNTPIISSCGGWKNRTVIGTIVTDPAAARQPKLYAMIRKQAVRSSDIIQYMKYLRRHLRGRKLILFWDGLSAHTAKETQCFIATQRQWLTVERTPTYAPEVNPPEYLWASIKAKNLTNTAPPHLDDLDRRINNGLRRVKRHPTLLRGCLKASGLFC